jgi:hypothetical protein
LFEVVFRNNILHTVDFVLVTGMAGAPVLASHRPQHDHPREHVAPRYGVRPGYGNVDNDGLLPVFIATATAALEWGAMPYASGVIGNQFSFYVRADGTIWHRG